MSLEENKSLFVRFGEALNARNFDAIRDLLAPDFVRHCQATPDVVVNNREQFLEYLKADATVFPDSRQTPKLVVAEGDFVAFWLRYEGTQKGKMGPFPPSHKRMLLDVGGIFRIRRRQARWVMDNMGQPCFIGTAWSFSTPDIATISSNPH